MSHYEEKQQLLNFQLHCSISNIVAFHRELYSLHVFSVYCIAYLKHKHLILDLVSEASGI